MSDRAAPSTPAGTARMRRRDVVRLAAATTAVQVTSGAVAPAAEPPKLEQLDPFGDIANYAILQPMLFDAAGGRALVSRLWDAYGRTGRREYGEWAAIYVFPWWRTASTRENRVKIARIGQKMAQKLAADHPDHVAGYQWTAIHVGTEILSVGVLDALNRVGQLRSMLEKATALDAGYFYGLPQLILAKAYAKLPPFPISIGDLAKARRLLEQLAEQERHVFAIWHLFFAETLFLQGDTKGALGVLAGVAVAVTPENGATMYVLESTLHDARNLAQRIRTDTYERYLWDPLLEPARPVRG